MVNLFFGSELNTCSKVSNTKFTLRSYLFRAGKLIASADPDKYGSSGHCIAFDAYSQFSFWVKELVKNSYFVILVIKTLWYQKTIYLNSL